MDVLCNDNRFEIIEKAKKHLLEATNIDTSPDEMKVLDSFLFRCWQMGWLDRYDTADRKTEPTISKMEQVEDETRLTAKCLNCANWSQYKCSKCDGEMYYKYDKDEPQTDYTPDCPFCKRYGTEDCLGSDCRHYKTYKTEPQTERSE